MRRNTRVLALLAFAAGALSCGRPPEAIKVQFAWSWGCREAGGADPHPPCVGDSPSNFNGSQGEGTPTLRLSCTIYRGPSSSGVRFIVKRANDSSDFGYG